MDALDIDQAAALLDRLEIAGLLARVVDGSLRIGPAGRMTDDLRAEIAAQRGMIVDLLSTALPAQEFDTDLSVFTDAEAGLDAHRLREVDALADELREAGPGAIQAMRWYTMHPAPGFDRGDHLAASLALRIATGRGPPRG